MGEITNSAEIDITAAGPMTLHRLGVSFAVGDEGQVLRYPDGMPIDGERIETMVARSGYTLTNAQAAGRLAASRALVEGVSQKLAELKNGEVVDEDKEK